MKNFKEKFSGFIIGFIVILLFLELGLRLWGSYFHKLAEADHRGLNPGHYNILCLGDSYTFGVGAPPEQSYPKQLEKLLNSGPDGNKYVVINRGQMGQNTTQVVKELSYNVENVKPRAIILMTGLNNSWNYTGYSEYLKRNSLLSKLQDEIYNIKIYKLVKLLSRDILAKRVKEAKTLNKTETKKNHEGLSLTDALRNGFNTPGNATQSNDTGARAPVQNQAQNQRRDLAKINLPPDREEEHRGRAPASAGEGQHRNAGEVDSNNNREGWALIEKHQYDEALSWFKQAIKVQPNNNNNYNALAIVYREKRDFNNAVKALQQAINVSSKNYDKSNNYNNLGRMYIEMHKYGEAFKCINKAMLLSPNDIHNFNTMSMIYMEEHKYDEALKWENKIIAIFPNNDGSYFNIGWIYRIKRNNAEALKWYKKAVIMNPDSAPRVIPRVMEIYDEEKNYDDAFKFFNELVAKKPELASTLKIFQEKKNIEFDVEKWITDDLDKIIKFCRDNHIILVLQDYPGGLHLKAYNRTDIIKRIASANALPFVDNYAVFTSLPNNSSYFVPDGHCNAKGYGVVAKDVYDKLKPLIK
jgi:tetratricopeptide (TPR) repeat protein